jgi:hypothetical protein
MAFAVGRSTWAAEHTNLTTLAHKLQHEPKQHANLHTVHDAAANRLPGHTCAH